MIWNKQGQFNTLLFAGLQTTPHGNHWFQLLLLDARQGNGFANHSEHHGKNVAGGARNEL
jgi:hypothetical protein